MRFTHLVGATLTRFDISTGGDRIDIETLDGRRFVMTHQQDCCESVSIQDVAGDIADLIGTPILMAEEIWNTDNPPEHHEEFLWTFYKLRTAKGDVTIRWLGESNGYYAVDVEFSEVTP